VQQHLVALAVNLQLASQSADADLATTKARLDEIRRDVEQALDAAGQLAQRIYPPVLEAGGLAAALRSAAATAGIRVSLELAPEASYPPEVAWTIYRCCIEAFEHAGAGSRARLTVHEQEGAIAFEVAADGSRSDTGFNRLRDRVEALGGGLMIGSAPGGGCRVSGSLPLSG
jgi:signal transduction histidine kinase